MTQDVLIRALRPDDAADLAEIVGQIPWFHPLLRSPLGPAVVADHLKRALASPDGFCRAAQVDGRVRGYLSAHWLTYLVMPAPELYVSELFIHQDWRGRGLGGMLLEAAEAEAARLGASRLMLFTGKGRECYDRGFYPGRGWVERPMVANFVREF